jgi:hypothetical protein
MVQIQASLARFASLFLSSPRQALCSKPSISGTDCVPTTGEPLEHWEARFLGTFAEIGDYFNVSATTNPVPGAQAAWHHVQEGTYSTNDHYSHYLR